MSASAVGARGADLERTQGLRPDANAARRPDASPLLALRGVTKIYGDKAVLRGIDLVVERGETLVVIGGSGSGKSTLARLIVGLEAPTAGAIELGGVDVTQRRDRDRHRFGMVFQGRALLDSMNVFDNVAFPLRERHDIREAEIRPRVTSILDALGLADARGKLPSELSGGMAKRVGIARAMVNSPEILVYDEPTSGLDPVTSRMVDAMIEELRERWCVTSIVITHDMATAYGIADRVVLLAGGVIAAEGPPESIFHEHDARLRPFALSSGVDPDLLARRRDRLTAAEVRDRWLALQEGAPPSRPSWLATLTAPLR
jgi:phospholipid/cholesterol/gamma-HCH transport system ATP-binding protein